MWFLALRFLFLGFMILGFMFSVFGVYSLGPGFVFVSSVFRLMVLGFRLAI